MKIKVFVRDKNGTLIDIFIIERDVSEYIKTTREVYGEEWADYLEQILR